VPYEQISFLRPDVFRALYSPVHAKWVPCRHDRARPQVVMEETHSRYEE
jgi:hypothetical protein